MGGCLFYFGCRCGQREQNLYSRVIVDSFSVVSCPVLIISLVGMRVVMLVRGRFSLTWHIRFS